MLSKLRGKGKAVFVGPAFFDIRGDEQQGASSPVGRRREPPLVWQGETVLPSSEFLRKREGSYIGELSSDPEMMFYWRRRQVLLL